MIELNQSWAGPYHKLPLACWMLCRPLTGFAEVQVEADPNADLYTAIPWAKEAGLELVEDDDGGVVFMVDADHWCPKKRAWVDHTEDMTPSYASKPRTRGCASGRSKNTGRYEGHWPRSHTKHLERSGSATPRRWQPSRSWQSPHLRTNKGGSMNNEVDKWTIEMCRDWIATDDGWSNGCEMWIHKKDEAASIKLFCAGLLPNHREHPVPATRDAAAKAMPDFDVMEVVIWPKDKVHEERVNCTAYKGDDQFDPRRRGVLAKASGATEEEARFRLAVKSRITARKEVNVNE